VVKPGYQKYYELKLLFQSLWKHWYTCISDMSMQTPPWGDKVCPSIDVAPPYGTIGTCLNKTNPA